MLARWIDRATATLPGARFPDAVVMGDELAAIAESSRHAKVDQTILDRAETAVVPYAKWPIHRTLQQDAHRHLYVATDERGNELVIKIWLGIRRGINASVDLAMTRLFESVRRLIATPLTAIAAYENAGLAPTAPS